MPYLCGFLVLNITNLELSITNLESNYNIFRVYITR